MVKASGWLQMSFGLTSFYCAWRARAACSIPHNFKTILPWRQEGRKYPYRTLEVMSPVFELGQPRINNLTESKIHPRGSDSI
jgi:hypothetical protein